MPAAAPGMFLQDGAVSEAGNSKALDLLRALEKTANSLRSDSAVFFKQRKIHSLRVAGLLQMRILEEHPRHGGGHGIWYW